MSEQIQADRLASAYIKMRDKKAELAKELEEKVAAIEEQMLMVEDELKKLFDEKGLESIRTSYGTVFQIGRAHV